MAALVCGSLAFDSIATFPGRFADQILPGQLHVLNVSFLVPTMRREFGGCAGNIAYNLAGLGGEPIVVAAVGSDGAEYVERLRSLGATTEHVRVVDDSFTAQAFIITDRENNQITAFHPGAMQEAHRTAIARGTNAAIAIVAPDGREAMLAHSRQLADAGIPFIFDPGQGLPMFDGAELRAFVDRARWVALNDYEASMLAERTGETVAAMSSRPHVDGVVVTLAAQGCEVWQRGTRTTVPGVAASEVVDPTGCGDAFRAAMLFGLERGWSLVECARLGNRLGALKIASRGGQNHVMDRTLGER